MPSYICRPNAKVKQYILRIDVRVPFLCGMSCSYKIDGDLYLLLVFVNLFKFS